MAPVTPPDVSFWSGRTVLLTGHTGFKGSWLSLWLQQVGAEVIGFSDGVPTTPSHFEACRVDSAMTSRTGDVRDADAVNGVLRDHQPEIVLHLAAQPLVRAAHRSPMETFTTNVTGTLNVLEAARQSDSVQIVLVVTSDKCYREGATAPHGEDDPLGGDEPYSASKACAEIVTTAYREAYLAHRGTAVASARAGNVIGGGDWAEDRLIPDIVRTRTSDQVLEVRHPGAVRPWQHVLDCLSGYLGLVERLSEEPELAGPWNFGPDDAASVEHVIETMSEHWPGGLDWRRVPDPRGPRESPVLRLDASRAHEVLGWRPRWLLPEALKRTVDWYVAHQAGQDMRAVSLAQIDAYTEAARVDA